MSPNEQKRAMVVLLCIASAAAGWAVWTRGLKRESAGAGTSNVEVLCDHCGYLGRANVSELVSHGDAARTPAFGPGYRCPKCGEWALYPNPSVCANCQTRYLVKKDASGAIQNKCPKCGTMN